ncbi:MAG: glycosyltransferase [Alphaproteobacteria bacterium]|nr:glycosyltransferase [Alphaproteobacteria bacterium]
MKLISVIIPVWNAAEYLPQCLDNIIYQTYKNLEIIIVDDGSPDNSAEIYNRYAAADKRIKIIKQKNSGQSAARNNALRVCHGEYVHFMDADDYINLDYYEKMLDAATATNADIAVGGMISEHANPSVIFDSHIILSDIGEKALVTRFLENAHVWRYLFRKSFIIDNNLFFEPGRIFEDMILVPRMMKLANRVVTVPSANYYYKNRPASSITENKNPAAIAKRESDKKYAHASRKKFMDENNLGSMLDKKFEDVKFNFIVPGITIAKIRIIDGGKKIKYYLFGIPLPIVRRK